MVVWDFWTINRSNKGPEDCWRMRKVHQNFEICWTTIEAIGGCLVDRIRGTEVPQTDPFRANCSCETPLLKTCLGSTGQHNSPIPSMYGIYIYTYIYHKNQPNVGKYTIHGSYGTQLMLILSMMGCLVLVSWESLKAPSPKQNFFGSPPTAKNCEMFVFLPKRQKLTKSQRSPLRQVEP